MSKLIEAISKPRKAEEQSQPKPSTVAERKKAHREKKARAKTESAKDFSPREDCRYKHDYHKIFKDITKGKLDEVAAVRALCLDDLWFVTHFVLRMDGANHPFVVDACREAEEHGDDGILYLWARGHCKSTVLTTALTIQKLLKNPEERVGIFSHTRPAAKAFLRRIKLVFENSEIIKTCFPEIAWANPQKQAPKWSEDDGITIQRQGFYAESSVEAYGLLEGMPTGKHYTHRVYDDIETADLVQSPDTINKLKDAFDMSQNLSSADGTHIIVGTTYHHEGLLQWLRDRKDLEDVRMYETSVRTATHNGQPDGEPVFLSKYQLDQLRVNKHTFFCQQLLDPTPRGETVLQPNLTVVKYSEIPKDLYRFMVIDQAGTRADGCDWAMHVVGVAPDTDDTGASTIYLLDTCIEVLKHEAAVEEIVRMYMRNGVILKVGVEKVGLSTTELHVTKALQQKGRRISVESGTLVLLRPANRDKIHRITSALAWPLANSKLMVSDAIPLRYRERIKDEIEKFPFWKLDGIDALSYVYDLIKDYPFRKRGKEEESEWPAGVIPFRQSHDRLNWMAG